METTVEAIVKLLAVIVPICGGLLWIMLKKVNKIDKRKVSYKVCDQRRAECPCKTSKGDRKP